MTVCAENIGFICLILSVAAILISFVTPYWIVVTRDPDAIVGKYHMGLLAYCEPSSCEWLVPVDNQHQIDKYPDWFKAVQGLMSTGLALGLIALLVTTLSLCCTCHSCNPHQTISGLMLTSSVAMAVAIIVFGVKANGDWNIQIEKSFYGFFGWSFWVGVGAAGLAMLTSFVYCCMGRNDRP